MSPSAKPQAAASDSMCFSFEVIGSAGFGYQAQILAYVCTRTVIIFLLTFRVPTLGFCLILWFPARLPHPLIALPALSLLSAKAATPLPLRSLGLPEGPVPNLRGSLILCKLEWALFVLPLPTMSRGVISLPFPAFILGSWPGITHSCEILSL